MDNGSKETCTLNSTNKDSPERTANTEVRRFTEFLSRKEFDD